MAHTRVCAPTFPGESGESRVLRRHPLQPCHWADSQGAPRLTSGVPAKLWNNLLHVNTTGKAGFAVECCFPPSFRPQPGHQSTVLILCPDPMLREGATPGSGLQGVCGAVSADLHFSDIGQLDMALTVERESSGITQTP